MVVAAVKLALQLTWMKSWLVPGVNRSKRNAPHSTCSERRVSVPTSPAPVAPGAIAALLAPLLAAMITLPRAPEPLSLPAALAEVLMFTVPVVLRPPVTDSAPLLMFVGPVYVLV